MSYLFYILSWHLFNLYLGLDTSVICLGHLLQNAPPTNDHLKKCRVAQRSYEINCAADWFVILQIIIGISGEMRICLINPPFADRFCRGARWQAASKGTALWMPIWLMYATGVLDKAGHQTRLFDCPARKQSRQDLLKAVRACDPGLIVLYTATGSIVNDLEIADLLKQANPRAITVATGPHVSVLTEDTLRRCPGADYVVVREFDYVLRDLAAILDQDGDQI
jgi:hypothetical protein